MTNFEEEEFSRWLISIAKKKSSSPEKFEKILESLGFGEEKWINSQFYLGGMQRARCKSWERGGLLLLSGVRNTMGNHQDRILRLPKT